MLKRIFGELLREQRKKKNLTQEGLAEACELSTYYISLLEAGKRQPTITTLFKLASALKTTPEELVAIVRRRARQADRR